MKVLVECQKEEAALTEIADETPDPAIKRNRVLKTMTKPDISKQAKTPPPGMTTSETTSLGWMMDGCDVRGKRGGLSEDRWKSGHKPEREGRFCEIRAWRRKSHFSGFPSIQ